ncbi:MAG: ATP-dependent metallopeptidase FtsH/Yme1/Tma family protein, partial [Pseudomonadota bacterium]
MGNAKNLAFWAILILLLVTLFSVFQDGSRSSSGTQKSFSEFLTSVEQGDVTSVTIDGETVSGRTAQGERFTTTQPQGADILDTLR